MIDGDWIQDGARERHSLRLGSVFTAEIYRGAGAKPGEFGSAWRAYLNKETVGQSADLEYAKGLVEWHIVNELRRMSDGYRRIKRRAPTSEDLFSAGGWARWKQLQDLLAGGYHPEGPTKVTGPADPKV
jgi:hypothetical protein